MFEYLKNSFFLYWRFLFLIGLILGMVLPWQLVYSDVVDFENNSAMPLYGWWEIKDSFKSLSFVGNYKFIFLNSRLLNIASLIGALCLMLYFLGNCYLVFIRPATLKNKFLLLLRVTGISSSLILLPIFISPIMNSEVAIGYHITAITIFGSFLLEGRDNMNLNAKYPYLIAWVGIIALNTIISIALLIVPYDLIRIFLQIIIGFFIFKFIIERNILPYITKHDSKIENSSATQ